MSKQPNWDLIAGIVLDAVGTLIKPVPSVAEAYTEAARRQGVELNRDEVRARFNTNFQSDEVRGDRGIHSTDEATEIWRWRRIVTQGLAGGARPGSGFRRALGPFRPARIVAMFSGRRPGLAGDPRGGDRGVRGLEFRRPAAPGGAGLARAELGRRRPGDLVGSRLSQAASVVLSRRSASAWACRPGRSSVWATTSRTTSAGRMRAGLSAVLLDRGGRAAARLAACAGPDGPARVAAGGSLKLARPIRDDGRDRNAIRGAASTGRTFASGARQCRLGLPDWTTWIRFRAGQEGPSMSREHDGQPDLRPDWTGVDSRVREAWSMSAPFREERKSPVVATVEQLAALVRGRLVGDGTVADPLGAAGRRGRARATSRSSRTSGTPSSCGPRPPRPRSSGPTSTARPAVEATT